MRLTILITTVLLWAHGLCANEYDPGYDQALKFKQEANYSKAVECFINVLKKRKRDHGEAKKICFEIADCYVKAGKEGRALYFMKIAIYDFGATIEDFKQNDILKRDFLAFAWINIAPKYNNLRRDYVSGLKNVDEYMNKEETTVSNAFLFQ